MEEEFDEEAYEWAQRAAVVDLEKEAQSICITIKAQEIPTLEQLAALNKAASYLYFVLNGG